MSQFKNISRLVQLSKYSYESIAVFNKQSVLSKLNVWNKYLPEITPYYAIKSLSDTHILNTIANNNIIDVGFDVASKNEIELIKKYNSPVILSNPIKSPEDISYAKINNIKYIVCDNIEDCNKTLSIYPDAHLIWRIKSIESYSLIKFNSKFGASIDDTINMLNSKNTDHIKKNIVGLSFHVGSKCSSSNAHLHTINLIIDELLNYLIINKINLKIINIGGGFVTDDDIINLGNSIKYYTINNIKNIEYIAEPGRYFSLDCIDLYTKIISIKEEKSVYNIYINDSIYNTFSGKVYDHQIFTPIPTYNNKEMKKCIIWGNTCDGDDIICESVYLPKPSIGDVLYWKNIGAYSLASSCDGFNGFKKALIVDYNDFYDNL
jgi:ornithine decarboxylase